MSVSSKQIRNQSKKQKETEINNEDKLKLLDEELMSFFEYCQQAGFTDAEMDTICAPLVSNIRKSKIKKAAKVLFVIILALFTGYLIMQIGVVNLYVSAMGRLFIIKMIPLWDWTSYYFESCLMANPFHGEYVLTENDCVTCEAIEGIDRVNNVGYEFIMDGYINRDAPVIVMDAMDEWPSMATKDFWFDNVTQIYLKDDKLVDTVPCILITNLRIGSSDLHAFLKKIHNPQVDKWFVHWQNCDINAVKALRKLYQRPYFLSNSVSPAHFNWVLMSANYNSKVLKKIELDTGLIMLAQFLGSTSFRLTPQNPCNTSCPNLVGDLHEGEILVFTNYMWNFEYFPGRHTDNVAILTETVWDENIM